MAKLKIKAFGVVAEKLPLSEFEFPYFQDTERLTKELKDTYPVIEPLQFSLAVDKQLVQEKTDLKGDEEIALLPPFSGG